MELILATRNDHKVQEVTRMLEPFGITVAPLPEHVVLPPEDGDTFEQNAMTKALTAARALGAAVIADDSGIEAQALGGRPGVRSARFAGEHASDAENLAKLLSEAPAGSALRYVCVIVFVASPLRGTDPAESDSHSFFGECRGTLAAAAAGAGGFGYDPAFIPDEYPGMRTMAQISAAEKDAISHRGRALRAFGQWFSEHRADNAAQAGER